jgi:hypothetical protein
LQVDQGECSTRSWNVKGPYFSQKSEVRGLLPNGDLPHAYADSHAISVTKQLKSIASLRGDQKRVFL